MPTEREQDPSLFAGEDNDHGAAESAPGEREKAGGDIRSLEKIWSRRMALLGLKRIFAAALEGARTEIRDGDGALVEVKFNPTAATAATKAIEVANKMLGYTTPEEEEEGDAHLTVTFEEGEELAK
jgi:hypothetical protein